ncbi:glycosyltransferase family 2 protein [Bradyrhizobium sp. BR13661]|jgi:hypothetical protein|uniref:glycosyltransferase family 2 protein n=1 Tax=Bradyrhizobium sp. BR13661 TaxID=2940622 RepID=UPI0024760E1E|nr:glycosyltransferase family 2 protein [Bradyrhizobium sp. BR13661]MDH6263521.1 glycosyltransferase involved in cell wall biosynthesis [Bradyrhizobium sp. BR13661]
MNIAVAIASRGRPEEIGQLIAQLRAQSLKPCLIVLSVVSEADVGGLISDPSLKIVFGTPGLCAQRNRALDALPADIDLIAFFDDDYLPAPGSLQGAASFFENHPDVTGATGVLLADGINSAGISYEEASALISGYTPQHGNKPRILREQDGLYGCNMIYRVSAIRGQRFDETLPLYGWQEDIDFASRMARRGKQVKTDAFAGVHRGVKSARLPGVRFGYSQIANPVYLVRKGTMRFAYAFKLVLRNIAANLIRSPRSEPWIDRPGRLKGNLIALRDLVCGRLRPEAVLEL